MDIIDRDMVRMEIRCSDKPEQIRILNEFEIFWVSITIGLNAPESDNLLCSSRRREVSPQPNRSPLHSLLLSNSFNMWNIGVVWIE